MALQTAQFCRVDQVLVVGQGWPCRARGRVDGALGARCGLQLNPRLRQSLPPPRPLRLRPRQVFWCMWWRQGDMLGSLAVAYDVDSAAIAEANNIALTAILHVGQELLIPGMTPTPSVTPTVTITPTATDAATPLPTIPPRPTKLAFVYRPPVALAPTQNSMLRGDDADVVLNWTSAGILAADEWYEVSLTSPCLNEISTYWTKATSWRLLPQDPLPGP